MRRGRAVSEIGVKDGDGSADSRGCRRVADAAVESFWPRPAG